MTYMPRVRLEQVREIAQIYNHMKSMPSPIFQKVFKPPWSRVFGEAHCIRANGTRVNINCEVKPSTTIAVLLLFRLFASLESKQNLSKNTILNIT